MASRDQAVFGIGALPFLLLLGASIVVSIIFVIIRLSVSDIAEITVAMGTIWMAVILVLIFVSNVCMSISPREHFTDISENQDMKEFNKAEAAVCTMIDDATQFIKNDIGHKGLDNPSLITEAIDEAIRKVDGPITSCPPTGPPTTTDELNERLSRMQHTLDQFLEPILKNTYDKSMNCDGFADFSPNRITTIQATIDMLTKKYLAPIQQKQKDLQAGHASDCDKKKGASSAVGSSMNTIKSGSKPGV